MIFSTSKSTKKHLQAYLLVTLGCAVFSFTYEYFSHQVYSPFMVYLFLVPLLLGVFPHLIYLVLPTIQTNNPWQNIFQDFAVATLTTGSSLQGIVEIYGTTSPYITYFFVAGFILLALSIIKFLTTFLKRPYSTASLS